MEQLAVIFQMLEKIERSGGENRKVAIGEFQEEIWADKIKDEELNDYLKGLCSDLNFYEPFEPDRTEELGYYDDVKLDELIGKAKLEIQSRMTG